MVEICIIEPCVAFKRASSGFIISKKDGQVQQITDLHSLNKAIIAYNITYQSS